MFKYTDDVWIALFQVAMVGCLSGCGSRCEFFLAVPIVHHKAALSAELSGPGDSFLAVKQQSAFEEAEDIQPAAHHHSVAAKADVDALSFVAHCFVLLSGSNDQSHEIQKVEGLPHREVFQKPAVLLDVDSHSELVFVGLGQRHNVEAARSHFASLSAR